MNKKDSIKRLHPEVPSSGGSSESSRGEPGGRHASLACYICGKLYHSGKARTLHVKMCARSKGISTPQLLAMIKQSSSLTKQEEKELQSNRELLAECDELFKKQPASKGGNVTKKKRSTYYDPVVAMEEEELQMALAISASLNEQETYFQQPEVSPKQKINESLLSPAAPASSEFVESRTDALLCPKTCDNVANYDMISKHCEETKNTKHMMSPENNHSSISTRDSAGKTTGTSDTVQTTVNNVVKITTCKVPNVPTQSEDITEQKFTMWNATSYNENESTEFFYVLPIFK